MKKGLGIRGLVAATTYAAIAICSSAALAEEFLPTSGTLIGSDDGDLLDFDCTPIGTDRITCDFVHVLLTNGSNDVKLQESLNTIPQLLEVIKSKEFCADVDARKAILGGETVAESEISKEAQRMIEGEEKLSSEASPQLFESMNQLNNAIDKLCLEKDAAAAREFLVLLHESGAEICKPMFNRYTQTFVRVDESLWVVESAPTGSCGIVNTSRLHGDPKHPLFWNYEASTIITNKSSTDIVPCSGLDERPQFYAWDQVPVYKNCKFLE